MNFSWRSLKQKIIAWLAQELRQYTQEKLDMSASCVLEKGAVLLPESIIENFSGQRSDIFIGGNSYIRGHLSTFGNGGRISVGEWCYVGQGTKIWSMNSVSIGNRVLISHNVNIHDSTAHSLNAEERHQHFRKIVESGHPRDSSEMPGVKTAPIVIEDDVWINFGVTILRGVRIGQRSIIAAGSIVTKDVPPDHLYRGAITAHMVPLSKEGTAREHGRSTRVEAGNA